MRTSFTPRVARTLTLLAACACTAAVTWVATTRAADKLSLVPYDTGTTQPSPPGFATAGDVAILQKRVDRLERRLNQVEERLKPKTHLLGLKSAE